MPSLQSCLIRFALQHRHWLRFKLTRPTFDASTSIPDFRKESEKAASRIARMPAGIEVSPITIDGLKAEWILPARATKDKVILYTHGGGYVSGSCSNHRSIVAKVVKGAKVGALLFDYRLAPEHPFPAALEDSVAAYRWLLAQGISPSHLMIVGESAGGGLCKAKNAGVDITLKVGEEMLHCFPLLSPLFPEAREAMDEICDFIKRHI